MDIYDQINREDLTDDLQLIESICGMDTVRILLREMGGIQIYVPKLTRLDNFINKYLKENSHKSYKSMARQLKVSEQFLKSFKDKHLSSEG